MKQATNMLFLSDVSDYGQNNNEVKIPLKLPESQPSLASTIRNAAVSSERNSIPRNFATEEYSLDITNSAIVQQSINALTKVMVTPSQSVESSQRFIEKSRQKSDRQGFEGAEVSKESARKLDIVEENHVRIED